MSVQQSDDHRSMRVRAWWLFALMVPLLAANIWTTGHAETLCSDPDYTCRAIQAGESWDSLFPGPGERDLVMRINRVNTRLKPGEVIAIPNNIQDLTINQLAPFPALIQPSMVNRIVVDQSQLAWAAYGTDGVLVHWGPMSGGKDYCADVKRPCITRPGVYTVYYKKGANCISKKFPVGKGGAKMPYCMFYDGGYALHGSYSVPGRHDSHGCVRLFIDDARWLNQEFVRIGETQVLIDVEIPLVEKQDSSLDKAGEPSSLQWH